MFQPMHCLHRNKDILLNMVSIKCKKLCFGVTQNISVVVTLLGRCIAKSKFLLIFSKFNYVQFIFRGLDIILPSGKLRMSNKKQK